ncbi:YciI family protein [Saccharopolyspora hirsuta]|uniref:YciI family protein n=1 Tax=Saccharopolyspora hirsuta TaxID=1837 RepID=A0A5M7BQ60_SACHI|nr:YciI family protein [Saccharopolyspora hirsuta]KAA5831949.1 YciI family protein [Saccharopolyspora hirsuta]
MRYMMIVKSTPETEAGAMPTEDELKAMGDYNEELVKSGVLLAGEGLHPSSEGFRTEIATGGGRTVVDGPFTEAKELIAGFWLLQVRSREEALEWAKRCPEPVEVRRVFEAEDFDMSEEEAAREAKLRDEVREAGGIA